jgi:uncharacterized membrane protein YdjX (TVP38/TMEM64 family)
MVWPRYYNFRRKLSQAAGKMNKFSGSGQEADSRGKDGFPATEKENPMVDIIPRSTKRRKGAVIKALLLVIFIAVAIGLIRFTPVKEFFTKEALGQFLDRAGFWAPLVFMLVYTAGICLFLPGTLLTALGAALFGAYWGFVFVYVGAMAGASVAFWIGRTLGRDFAASLIGERLKRYDEAIERHGFATVLYLRLIYFPFTVLNFGMGLTKVKFGDYFMGTGLGILVGTFILTFFVGTIKDVWAGGDWGQLISFKAFFSVGLFVFSLFIPKIIKKIKKEKE